jgi:hypothetical protein
VYEVRKAFDYVHEISMAMLSLQLGMGSPLCSRRRRNAVSAR